MNGDIGKLNSGAAFAGAVPETSAPLAGLASSATAVHHHSHEYIASAAGPSVIPIVNGIAEDGPMLPPEGSGPLAHSSAQSQQPPAYPLPQLKQMLSQQLEYYFSRENLANDAYLLSQMDNDQYVPIWTVANFNQVKKLTKDIKLITEVLRESPNVQVDEEGIKVRPNHKRCIVILREIPDTTPLEDVKNLFNGENCPKLVSCEFAHNSSWYVTFESDEDAQKAYRFLREEVREFQGRPIMARIKAKPIMCRAPMVPAVVPAPPKNGFRATPPPQAVFDPGAFPPGQQRFVYANGAPGQPPVPAAAAPPYNPLVYGYQQQFPNYVAPWPAATGYFDISSVFQVNGLAPQQYKPQGYSRGPGQGRMNRNNKPRGSISQQQSSNSNEQQGSSHSNHSPRVPSMPHSAQSQRSSSPTSGGSHHMQYPQNSQSGGGAVHHHNNHHQSGQYSNAGQQQTGNNGGSSQGSNHATAKSSKMAGNEGAVRPALEPIDHQPYLGGPYVNAGIPPMGAIHPDGTVMADIYRIPAPAPLILNVPPRHRRKKRDEESMTAVSISAGANINGPTGLATAQTQTVAHMGKSQFDLVDEAFPPLPGFDPSNGPAPPVKQLHNQIVVGPTYSNPCLHNFPPAGGHSKTEGSTQTVEVATASAAWGENRLADVVKGVAKGKNGNGKMGEIVPKEEDSSSPRSSSPLRDFHRTELGVGVELSIVTMTPPSSPQSNSLQSASLSVKCTMSDKSTKTDDVFLNGCEREAGPTTTNAATMTTVVVQTEAAQRPAATVTIHSAYTRQESKAGLVQPAPAPSPPLQDSHGYPPRMSYAQVAQHHKENQMKAAAGKQVPSTPTSVASLPPTPQSEKPVEASPIGQSQKGGNGVAASTASRASQASQQAERDSSVRDNRDSGYKGGDSSRSGPRNNATNGRQGTHDRPARRKPEARQSQLRDFVTAAPRSPK